MDKDSAPLTLNDAAYTLADNNLLLPDALRYAKEAVEGAEEDTADIDLENLTLKDLQTVPVLAAYWDTLGWVYFRMGQFDQAENYLRPAWMMTQDPVIADHLQQVYDKQKKKREVARDPQAL